MKSAEMAFAALRGAWMNQLARGLSALLTLWTTWSPGQELSPRERELLNQWHKAPEQIEKPSPKTKQTETHSTTFTFASFEPVDGKLDLQQEFSSWLKAAQDGDPVAQFNVGLSYHLGRGIDRDYSKAVDWYHRTTEPMDSFALFQLGWMFDLGLGFTRNHDEAVKRWQEALEKGYTVAKRELNLVSRTVAYSGRVSAENVRMARITSTGLLAYKGYRAAKRELEFDTISFKDPAGNQLENVHVVDYTPDAVFYRMNDGICCGEVKLANLPPELQRRFGYSPANAEQYNKKLDYERRSRLPDAPPAALEPWVEEPNNQNAKIVTEIVYEYHKNHEYRGTETGEAKEIFVCGDMARDVWDQIKAKRINAKIQIGNPTKRMKSLLEANHAWVMAEVSPGKWLALECTGGYVVYFGKNENYYRGHAFPGPAEEREYETLLKDYDRARMKYQDADENYHQAVREYQTTDNIYSGMGAGFRLAGKQEALRQRTRDLNEVVAKLKAVLGEKD